MRKGILIIVFITLIMVMTSCSGKNKATPYDYFDLIV